MNKPINTSFKSHPENRSMLVAVGWPDNEMRDAFSASPEVVYYDDLGWTFKRNGQEELVVGINRESETSRACHDPTEIRYKLQKWLPVIYRWSSLGSKIEHQLSDTVLLISRLMDEIKLLNIKVFIFHTGVPHHYDSMVLSIACELSKVKQIFLYANVFDGALIPLCQDGSLIERKVLSWKEGETKYSNLIDEYISKRLRNVTPTTSDPHNYLSNWWKVNLGLAFSYLFYGFIRKKLGNFYQVITGVKKVKLLELKDYSLIDHMKMMWAQRSFVNLYYKRCVSFDNINQAVTTSMPVKLLIAAHYQPEATSFPEGWDYHTHIDIVLKIRSLGYSDSIFYKEHYGTKFYIERYVGLTRVGLCRNRQYLKALIDLNCILIAPDLPVPMQDGYLAVTITGTIAIERALAGLHTVVCGRPWYLGLPGTVHIDELATLRTLPINWVTPDPEVAKQAKNFILEHLDNNTLTNVAGIGVGKGVNDALSCERYKGECLSLLRLVK